MIHTIEEALSFIEGQRINNTSLEDFKQVFKKYRDFQKEMHFIHITGTNGKGSTSKMLSDVLLKSGYDVGLFTSPHMIVANDRIRINDNYISDERLIHYVNKYQDDILEYRLNFFQIYTLIALSYFYDEMCDIAIIEVGIGGLLDSTNVIDGMISIISNISFDHTDKLGNSIEDIAHQKAGIIKENTDVISRVTQAEAKAIIQATALKKNASVSMLDAVSSCIVDHKREFEFEGHTYRLNSLAKYQVDNALLVLKALNILSSKYDYQLKQEDIQDALNEFEWIGRFECVTKHPEIILDGAHNIAGIKAMINSDEEESIIIFSALKDKDYQEMLNLLQERYEEVVFAQFDFYRSLKQSDLVDYPIQSFSNVQEALLYVVEKYPNRRIIMCGSLYFISDVRKYIKGEFNDSNK